MIPGITPPMNNEPVDSSVMLEKTIIALLGGIRIPRVPPAARRPRDNLLSYSYRLSSGRATSPMMAAVATLEPEIAQNRTGGNGGNSYAARDMPDPLDTDFV